MAQHSHRHDHHDSAASTPVGLRRHKVLFGILVALALLALAAFVITNFESLLPGSDVPESERTPN